LKQVEWPVVFAQISSMGTVAIISIEDKAPHITAAFHKFMAQLQSERLASVNATLRALLK